MSLIKKGGAMNLIQLLKKNQNERAYRRYPERVI
jgi:hypothetical protein